MILGGRRAVTSGPARYMPVRRSRVAVFSYAFLWSDLVRVLSGVGMACDETC